MRVRVELARAGDGWAVRTIDLATGAALVAERVLNPPLFAEEDDAALDDRLSRLFGRAAKPGEIEHLGRRLFALLFDEASWQAVRPVEGGALALELALPPGDADLGRLPWEMLHDGQGFLAMQPNVSLLRRVPSPAAALPAATAPLSLLVVVGTGLADDAIRPAAEFVALVQNLRALGLDRRLRPHLLFETTPEQLQAAIAEHRPAIVHVIAHGRASKDGPRVELRDGQRAGAKLPVAAAALGGLLRDPEGALPAAVVLSVCHTAEAGGLGRFGVPASSFAAELVGQGVPLVVGMGGRVSDLACRLFTRAFYAALLGAGDPVSAAAAGRRVACAHGGYDPGATIDWALPALFVAAGVEPRLEIEPAPLEQERTALADQLAPGGYPPFCDRLDVLARGDLLLAGSDVQKRLGGELQTLVLRAAAGEAPIGRTWALQALAARAAMAGHLPLLVARDVLDPSGDLPADWRRFVELLELAAELALGALGLPPRPCAWSRWLLGGRAGDAPGPLPEPQLGEGDAAQPVLLGRALRLDLLDLLAAVRAHPGPVPRPEVRLLLLVDDVHRMGELAEPFLASALGPFGLRQCRADVRVAFVSVASGQPYQTAILKIESWLAKTPWARAEPLQGFSGFEERLAYQNFLLGYRHQGQLKPLAPAREGSIDPEFVEGFFRKLSQRVQGLPTKLVAEAEDLIDVYLGLPVPVLIDAYDEEIVDLWHREGAPW